MFSTIWPSGLMFLVLIAGIFLVIKILSQPIKLIFKIIVHIISGFLLLFLVNYIGAFIGISIAVTWFTALIAGCFGIPGVIVLLLLAL